MESRLQKGRKVEFPEFTGERVYMFPFKIAEGLPDWLKRWDTIVKKMLEGVETEDFICLTIDQGHIEKGTTQRRNGKHVDCAYNLNFEFNDNPTPGFKQYLSATHGAPPPIPGHRPRAIGGGMLLAASHIGCKGYRGTIDGWPEMYGDCDHLNVEQTEVVELQSNVVYLANATMVHETIGAACEQDRQFVRLSMPTHSEIHP